MKKKQRGIISLLLTIIMLSTVFNVYAESSAETAENIISSAAEKDTRYQEGIGFLEYLGIFKGDDSGDMKSETNITRAEMAAVILRMMNIEELTEYKGEFEDVTENHWAANVIQTAYENSIISGMGDGTFAPDKDVTYEQAVKMVLCAVNYGAYAEDAGGYPMGYIKQADKLDISEMAEGTIGESVIRRTVAKLIYNALTVDYPIITYIENSISGKVQVEYETRDGITILSEKRDIFYTDDVITATTDKTIGTMLIAKENQIAVGNMLMDCEVENADDYVSLYCRIFYREDKDGYKTAVYIISDEKKNESITIQAEDIDSIVTSSQGTTASITYFKTENRTDKLELEDGVSIVYNDRPFTLADYAEINPVDDAGKVITFDEFITPKAGSVKLVDTDDNRKYDIIFIESYEVSIVKAASSIRLQLEYPISLGDIIKFSETDDEKLNLNVIKDGKKAELSNLVAGDVVAFKINANYSDQLYTGEKYVTIEATSEYIEGTLETISGDNKNTRVVIDGAEYYCVDNEAVLDEIKIMVGSSAKFLLDKFGRIAGVDGVKSGSLVGGEEYGWLVNVYPLYGDGGIVAKIYTSDAEMKEFPLASSVDFWAPTATTNEMKSASEIENLIKQGGNDYFLQCKATDEKTIASIRLCKYRKKSDGIITKLYLAVDEKTVSETSNAVRVDTADHKGSKVSSEMFAEKYLIEEPVAQFTVPLDPKEISRADNYNYRYASNSEFEIRGDKGLGYNCFFADTNDYTPAVSIKFIKGGDAANSISDYSSADDNATFVVSSIGTGVDENGDTIYTLRGFSKGKEVSYTTTRNTLVAQVNPPVRLTKETYDTTELWTGSSEEKLTDIIHKGDILGIDGTSSAANIFIRFVDAEGLANHILGGGDAGTVPAGQMNKDEMFSSGRDRVVFGYVNDTQTSPMVRLNISVSDSTKTDEEGDVTDSGANEVTVGIKDISAAVTFVRISQSGKITVDKEASDVYEVRNGDYVFVRRFKNDALREVYAIRFE